MSFPGKSILRTAFNLAAGVIMIVDAVARPVYKPLLDRVAELEAVRAFEEAIARLPRAGILAAFAVPFVIAEPAKVLALVWLAEGRLFAGVVLLALAYLATFLVVERIHHAGRDKLHSYAWFDWAVRQLVIVRGHLREAGAGLYRAFMSRFNR